MATPTLGFRMKIEEIDNMGDHIVVHADFYNDGQPNNPNSVWSAGPASSAPMVFTVSNPAAIPMFVQGQVIDLTAGPPAP